MDVSARLLAYLDKTLANAEVPGELVLPDGPPRRIGKGAPRFRIVLKDMSTLGAAFDEMAFAEAYINGAVDLEGDLGALMQLRTRLPDPPRAATMAKFLWDLWARPETRVNREAIQVHYEHGEDFYKSFLDTRHHVYSQCIFRSPDESLEQAAENKLAQAYDLLGLEPGMRVLNIGGGWGGINRYFGQRGIRMTDLTISDGSFACISKAIADAKVPCEVLQQDFMTYVPSQPFDAVVIFGVIEHLVDYAGFTRNVMRCLKPGGGLYLDASATQLKFDVGGFTRKYIYPGTHSFMCLPELLQELITGGMEVRQVVNETEHYARTMREWALRFDRARPEIVAKHGERLFRIFQLYLWAGAAAFPELLQGYHVVARKGPVPPKANVLRRLASWAGRGWLRSEAKVPVPSTIGGWLRSEAKVPVPSTIGGWLRSEAKVPVPSTIGGWLRSEAKVPVPPALGE